MELLRILGTINFAILIGSLIFNLFKGTFQHNDRGFSRAIYTIAMLIIGFQLATLLPEPESMQAGYSMCSTIVEGEWWDCSGWPIFLNIGVNFVDKFAKIIGTGGQIPAAAAGFLGSWYIHVRLFRGLTFEPKDIARAFAGGFLVYASLAFMPTLSGLINTIMKDLVSFMGRVENGQETLRSFFEVITAYKKYAAQEASSINIGIWILRGLVILPLGTLTAINFAILVYQHLLMAFIPFSVFLATLKRNADPTVAISMLTDFAILSIIQGVEWALISLMPAPTVIENFQNYDSWLMVSAVFGEFCVFGLMIYILGKFVKYSVYEKAFKKLFGGRIPV